MTENDNFKYYYGQSLINEDTVNEYKSIMDYIVANGGHGSGIDADMLDGHESTDFLLITEENMYMSPNFYIGYTPIKNKKDEGTQFLGPRDIQCIDKSRYLYMFEYTNSSEGESVLTLYQQLFGNKAQSNFSSAKDRIIYNGDWDTDHNNKLLDAGLCDLELAINALLLYENENTSKLYTEINGLKERTPSEDQYKLLQDLINNCYIEFTVYDQNGTPQDEPQMVLNAGAVNGLQFFLVTQEQYELYPEVIREDPRYIFIIRDSVPDDYMVPTTIAAGRILLKTNGDKVQISTNGGTSYYDSTDLYQFNQDGRGLLPMYVDEHTPTLPTILADPSELSEDYFFINGLWMKNFLELDDLDNLSTLKEIINHEIAGLESEIKGEIREEFNDKYELKTNKKTDKTNDDVVSSITYYPSTYLMYKEINALKNDINELSEKIGQIDNILSNILGTGSNNNG